MIKLKHHRISFSAIHARMGDQVIADPSSKLNPLAFRVLTRARDHLFAVALIVAPSSLALLFRVAVRQGA